MPRAATKTSKPTGAARGVRKTDDHWDQFFEDMVRLGGNMSRACEINKITREIVYNHRQGNPEFEARFKEAKRKGVEAMEDEATRRAVEGVQKGIYHQGAQVAIEREYSDGLVQFLLKANAPEKFKERSEVTNNNLNANAGPLPFDLSKLTKNEVRTLLALTRKAEGPKE